MVLEKSLNIFAEAAPILPFAFVLILPSLQSESPALHPHHATSPIVLWYGYFHRFGISKELLCAFPT